MKKLSSVLFPAILTSIILTSGCVNNDKLSMHVTNSEIENESERYPYKIALAKIKENKIDEADAILWKEIGDVYKVRLSDLSQEKQDLTNLYYYVKFQEKLMANDYIHVVNYLNQLKPIDTLISQDERIKLLDKYQPIGNRQWELQKSQSINNPVYTKEQLDRDSKAPSKDPADYNKNGEYVPKNGVSSNPADYNVKGEYKPIEKMTQEEKRKELEEMLKKALK